MRLEELYPKILTLLKIEDAPHLLVIHCGGNNIPGDKNYKSVNLRFRTKGVLLKLSKLLPSTTLIWSQILPRIHWRGGLNQAAMERTRVRLNSYVATLLLRLGVH
jgi:hypothetical protein